MKKILFALMLFVNILGFSALKNGIYSVEKRYDGNWNSFVKLTVKDGKIIGAQYDRKNQKGELFSMSQNSFRDIALEISRNLINSQNVSSVTGKDAKAVSEFKEMSNFLMDKANNIFFIINTTFLSKFFSFKSPLKHLLYNILYL